MAALWNIVIGTLKDSDIVLEVVDARCAKETRSEKIESIADSFGKDLLVVVNKRDLVPAGFLDKLKQKIERPRVFVSAATRKGTRELKDAIYARAKKGKLVNVSVVGYPNTGKSSIINLLVRSQSTGTSSQPGFTKHAQWIRLKENIRLLDTPGVVPVDEKFSAAKSNIRPESTHTPESDAEELLEKMKSAEGNNIKDIYGFEYTNIEDFLETLANKMHCLKKGGVPDTDKAARKVLLDWNKGILRAWWY